MKKLLLLTLICFCFNAQSQQVLLHENFDPPSYADSIVDLGGWNVTDTLFPGTYYFHSKVASSQTNRFQTGLLPIPNLTSDFIILEFDHFCKIDFMDFARISMSLYNNPNVPDTFLYRIPDSCYFGSGNYAGNGGRFVPNSYYTLWQPVNPAATPQSNWWRHEIFYLNYGNALFNNEQFFNLQVYLKDGGSHGLTADFGWAVDNFKLSLGPFTMIPETSDTRCIVYPNPVTRILCLGKCCDKIQVYSTTGSLAGQYFNTDTIDLSMFPTGVYFVEVNDIERFTVVKN